MRIGLKTDYSDGLCRVCGVIKKFITKPHPTKKGWVIVDDICKQCNDAKSEQNTKGEKE